MAVTGDELQHLIKKLLGDLFSCFLFRDMGEISLCPTFHPHSAPRISHHYFLGKCEKEKEKDGKGKEKREKKRRKKKGN